MKRFVIPVTVVLAVMALMAPAFAQPTNDDLTAATEVTGLPFTETLDTTDATVEPGEPVEGDEFCPPRGSTVWYALTLDTTQPVSVNTAGSDYDTTLAVYTGSGFGDLSLVDCNDDTFFGLEAAVTFEAEAGVTYLVQVGSFGGDFGGLLQISFAEPGKTTGKPIIFKSQFRGLIADAFIEEFDETTGAFSFTSVNLVDGQSHEKGKPSKFSSLFVSTFEETFDEEEGTFRFTEWFGFADLSKDQFAIDKKLKSAWVETDLVLFGQTCTGSFEFEEFECIDHGSADVTADVVWDGVGGISKSQFKEKSTFDGVRIMFRDKSSSRNADVSGGVTGEIAIDLSDSFGSLSSQTTGDFIMIRGAGIP
jgi:hypothetical protein